MKFHRPDADVYVPDGVPADVALARTTHLGIGAHQDDLEIFAYSAIASCYRQPDEWFTGVVVTDGAGSARSGLYAGTSDEGMKAVRREEQRKAAFLGGYAAQIQLAHPSRDVKDRHAAGVVDDLEAIFRACRADTVYLHNPADKHDTHIAVLGRCLTALRRLAPEERPRRVLGCEVWRDLDWLADADKVVLDASPMPNLAASLLGVFDSQISGGKRYDLAALGRRLANATFFESHATDKSTALTWAMDLTPLLTDESCTLAQLAATHLDRFKADVLQRLDKFA